MKKQKLLKLPVMPRRQVYPDKRKAYEAAVHEETVDGESVLVIELYCSRNDEVTYRIFLGQTDYVTCKLLGKEEQWTHKDIGELIGEIWVNGVGRTIKTEVYTFPEDVEKIKRFTGFTGNHVENIQEYQEKLRKEQRIRRDKKVTDVWDEEIGVLPPLPERYHGESTAEYLGNLPPLWKEGTVCQYGQKGLVGTGQECVAGTEEWQPAGSTQLPGAYLLSERKR